jgi:F-type H+-transporting ATPase subunit a
MEMTQISLDQTVYWQYGFVRINATIVYTWIVMGILIFGAWIITRRLSVGKTIPRRQNLLEYIVEALNNEINALTPHDPRRYTPFIGTLFIFILLSNVLDLVPGFNSPAASLSTTAGLAICVFFAVPIYGITDKGVRGYLRHYIQPTLFMLPFNIIGELSRTLAMAIRLFGNVMSATKIGAILLAIAPLFFPIIMHALGLITGVIQAYIFAILAMVYIASASRSHKPGKEESGDQKTQGA